MRGEGKEMRPPSEPFGARLAETFKDQQVVDAYSYRPPYPQEVFALLASLVSDEPKAVLDVGSGSGDIARSLVALVDRVDAVDFSQRMIQKGKQLPNGKHPRLHWIYGKVEEIPLAPPYALITAGSSIHWPAWEVAFPRFHRMLTPSGSLALIYRRALPMPWESEIRAILAHFSDHQGHKGSNAIKELEARGFFRKRAEKETAPLPFFQSLDDYIEGLHSRSGFSRERMGKRRAADLDQQVRTLLQQFHQDEILPLQVVASVTWGIPEDGGIE
jgi:ubiquinone/menaquinone biosynthesis C-methylase UbiE